MRFDNVSGRSGIFVAGAVPAWIFCIRSSLRVHPFVPNSSNEVACCTTFHNLNCERGFVYFSATGDLTICELAPLPEMPKGPQQYTTEETAATKAVDYDHFLSLRTIPLHCQVHFVCQHRPTMCYAVVVSRPVSVPSFEEETERTLPVKADKYELLLFSSVTWQIIGRYDDFSHLEGETVLAAETVYLNNSEYICLGTAFNKGEDQTCRGRVILFDLYYAIGYTAQASAANTALLKMRVFLVKEKSPCTALTSLAEDNVLCAAVGQKLQIYFFSENALNARAFIDLQFYVVSLKSIKSYICYVDFHRVVGFVLWDGLVRHLSMIARTYFNDSKNNTAVDWVINGKELTIGAADFEGNFQLYQYHPSRPEINDYIRSHTEHKGEIEAIVLTHIQRLQLQADYHCGSPITQFHRCAFKSSVYPNDATDTASTNPVADDSTSAKPDQPNHLTLYTQLFATHQHGAISQIFPIPPEIYQRIFALSVQIVSHIPLPAALNARSHRLYSTTLNVPLGRANSKKGVVDGQILYDVFNSIDIFTQQRIAQMCGTTPDEILKDLAKIEAATKLY